MSDTLKWYVEEILRESDAEGKERVDLADELYDHLLCIRNEYVEKGMSEAEANQLAMQEFGDSRKIGRLLNPYRKIVLAARIFIIYHIIFITNFFVLEYFLFNTPLYGMIRIGEIPLIEILIFIFFPYTVFMYIPHQYFVMFVMIGLVMPIAWKQTHSWIRILALSVGISFVILTGEYLSQEWVVSMFDLKKDWAKAWNTLIQNAGWLQGQAVAGGLAGFLILKLLLRIKPIRKFIPAPSNK
ncbi:permease prefix domain 1-containing protein [Polycladomyces subterraneus]|uniref:Permease prefix domain 1-containing protein n=1 Tax=Polycladomyces subterraneus TaxID=1016997 RepID=A0ABT8IM53_9BACL|nr:permease prefix domain 1-containing protein [Polycladomyces subterraneus]MDN4593833.1 permease prefix domain 1-containing protein [Polycladomyces subterraneus]